MQIYRELIQNIIDSKDEKFKQVKINNKRIVEFVSKYREGLNILKKIGFI